MSPLTTTGRIRPHVDDGVILTQFPTTGRSFVSPQQFSQRESFFFFLPGLWGLGFRGVEMGEVDLFLFFFVPFPATFAFCLLSVCVWNPRVGQLNRGMVPFFWYLFIGLFLIN